MIVAAALLAVPLVLLAAKVHGRQLRLEREAQGLGGAVDFADPPPRVALLWRRDRIRFWITLPALALVLLGMGAASGFPWPQDLVFAAGAAPFFAFGALGLDSLRRAPQPPITWGWWLALVLAGTAWFTVLLAP